MGKHIEEWCLWISASIIASISVPFAFYYFGRFDEYTAIGYAIILLVLCSLMPTLLLVFRYILYVMQNRKTER